MAGIPTLWHIPDTKDCEKTGHKIEVYFTVVDEVATVMGLATEGATGGATIILAESAFLLGAFSVVAGGLFGEFWSIGAGYAAAKTIVVKDCMARGFALGAVLAAHGRKMPTLVRMFGRNYNVVAEEYKADAQQAHHAGLTAGFIDVAALRPQQKRNLWVDLETRSGDRWGKEEADFDFAAQRFYA